MRTILSLSEVTCSYRVTMGTRIGGLFCVSSLEGVIRNGKAEYYTHAVSGRVSSKISRLSRKNILQKGTQM